jgi:hypothetical protein
MNMRIAEERAREAYYARYDQAVASLSPGLRARATLSGFHEERDGSWRMYDALGYLLAEHKSVARIEQEQEEARKRDDAQRPRAQPDNQYVTQKMLGELLVGYGKMLGGKILKPLQEQIEALATQKTIDHEVVDELAATMERLDALENGDGMKRLKFFFDGSGDDAGAELHAHMDAAVERYFARHPIAHARGVERALIDRGGELVLTMSDGEIMKLGRVVGRDGMSLESRELRYDCKTHEIVERWSAGETVREFRYPAGGIHYAGYWTEGMLVRAHQAVTEGGSLWIALRDTKAKPCHENKEDWRIAARKGRDARIEGVKQ